MTTPRQEIAKYLGASELSQYFVDKMGIISVKNYRAKGDGVTDDHNAIQDAIDTAVASGNKLVWFPHGTYANSTTLTDSSGLSFIGDNVTITGTTYTVRNWSDMLTENSTTVLNMASTLANHTTRIEALESTSASFTTSISSLYSQTTALRTDLNTHTTDKIQHLPTTATNGAIPYYSTSSTAWVPLTVGTSDQFLLGGAVPSWGSQTVTKIASYDTTAPVASVDITSIPNTYKNLRLYASLKNTGTVSNVVDIYLRFNNDATAGNHASVLSNLATTTLTHANNLSGQNVIYAGFMMTSASTNGAQASALEIFIPNYASTILNKPILFNNYGSQSTSASGSRYAHGGGYYNVSTSPINRITISASDTNLAIGSNVQLYGYT